MRLKSIVVCALIFVTGIVHAQETTCEQTLNEATDEFNAGRFYSVPGILAPCIKNGFSNEQKQRAYLLLAQTYLLLDDPIAAGNSYLEVLRANPEFATDPARDPIDIVYLSKKYTASPVFSVYARIGSNVNPVRVIHTILPSSGITPIETKYSLRPGFQILAGGDWHYSENLALSAEFGYALTPYKRERLGVFGRDVQVFTDRLSWITLPVMVKYSFDRFYRSQPRKILPQVFTGMTFSYLLAARGDIQVFNNNLGETDINTLIANSPTLDFMPYRNKLNTHFFIGAAAKYKFKLDYLFAEIRYGFGLNNLVVKSSTFSGEPAQVYGHTDDYFRLDNLSISVGFVKPLYKPRELKRARTKAVLKEIKQTDDEEQR